MSLTIVVQAGGESQRMGTNKALIPFLGIPLIQRVIERVRPLANEILITTNQPDELGFLGMRLVADIYAGRGALVGLHTALVSSSHPYVGVVACDMPFVSPVLLAYQLDCLKQDNVDLVVPLTVQGHEPFHAVYRKSTCLPAVESALARGQKRMISWYPEVRVRELEHEDLVRIDPSGLAFMNINTPEEFQAAERLAQSAGV